MGEKNYVFRGRRQEGKRLLIKALVGGGGTFQQFIKLLRTEVVIKEINRIQLLTILVHFIVAMGAG
jgi:hypothetical protein